MSKTLIESATLFTPGRASYLDETNMLQLTEASSRRGEVAANAYRPDLHDVAAYAGGYPGWRGWDESSIPPMDRREANLMASPLIKRLESEGKDPSEIERIVAIQGDSSNSFGDVILSIERGLLDPNRFNEDSQYGIELAVGMLHGIRFKSMLSTALDIDPKRIRRIAMRDVYGTPEYPQQAAEGKEMAIARELAAIAMTKFVLRGVKPGDIEGLKDAEEHFMKIATAHS